MSNTKWYEDRGEMIAFGKVLDELGVDPWEYIEKPWKWDDEHTAWEKLGRPAEVEDIDDLNVETWHSRIRKNELERRYGNWP